MHLNLATPLLPQLAPHLGGSLSEGGTLLTLGPLAGEGCVKQFDFPGGLCVRSLAFTLRTPLEATAIHPPDSPYTLINLNRSAQAVDKTINQTDWHLDRSGPAGVLVYGPDAEILNAIPAGIPFDLVQICVPLDLPSTYPDGSLNGMSRPPGDVAYAPLPPDAGDLLNRVLAADASAVGRHANLLKFLGLLAKELSPEPQLPKHRIHPTDLAALMQVASDLRQNRSQPAPSTAVLAARTGASLSKFKVQFKQLFGTSPGAFHRNHGLAFARRALREQGFSVSEISYELGYADPAKFSRAYKRKYGVPPSRDRRLG